MKTGKDLILFGASLVIVIGLATVLLLNHGQSLFPEKHPVLPFDPGCDLQATPCELPLPGGGKIWMEMSPRPVKPMEEFTITVKTEGEGVWATLVDFRGVSMNMGINRVSLGPEGTNAYTTDVILPICVRQRMDWEAQVWLDTPQGPLIAPFRFDTIKD